MMPSTTVAIARATGRVSLPISAGWNHRPGRGQGRGAFTLLELLIVISIIAVLGGMAIVGVQAALNQSKVSRTETMIQALVSGLKNYEAKTGGAVRGSLDEYANLGFSDPNDINTGIETLLVVLRTTRYGEPFIDITSFANALQNADQDFAPDVYEALGIESDKHDLFELVDPWGNPLVYVPASRYHESFTVMNADGDIIEVKPMPLASTGTFPEGYMIWSFGPNGINENGRGDDITSWPKSDADKQPLDPQQ